MLNNEAERVMVRNPIVRIMRIEKSGANLVIETTEQKLAEYRGRILHHAHNGDPQVASSGSPGVCRLNRERWP
jgi:hypothetical protein